MQLHIDTSSHTNQARVTEQAATLVPYITHLQSIVEQGSAYTAPESSLYLPSDQALLDVVEQCVAEKKTPNLRYIFVIGIGGSNLGTKAIYDALYGMGDLVPTTRPKMVFVDTNDAAMLNMYVHTLIPTLTSKDEYLVVTISKSGGTTETLANTEILLARLDEQCGDVHDRVVVITDQDSLYWQAAGERQMTRLAIPVSVGGRYSVFSAVGLFPLALLGVDIHAFRQGACDVRERCLVPDPERNPAIQSAAILAQALHDGKTIHDTFVFNSELESLGKWYRQLMGESLGKEKTVEGDEVHTGITPTVSIGSTDLHSVGQLYLGGPKDKITTFVYTTHEPHPLTVPAQRMFPTITPMISGRTTSDIMRAILGGVQAAYVAQDLPFMDVQLNGITPYELGAYMQYKMIEMMCVGTLLHVNPFDQPHVELYKVETKRLLTGFGGV
jgi:glucose-6-phosphate isomerase